MNKNMKKIIAVTMALNTLAMIGPEKNFNILLNTASASKYDDPLLGELEIEGYSIDFDKEKFSYKIKVDKDVDQITVKAKPNDSAYTVFVDGDDAKEDKKYKVDVDIKQGESTVPIIVKDEEHNLKTEYDIEVLRGSESLGEDLDENDVYLDNITLSAGDIDFSSTKTKYDVYIEDSVRYLDIKAKPVDVDDAYVDINDEDVDDDFKATVSLKDGKNKIVIRVEDSLKDNKVKKYTLNVYNGVKPPEKDKSEENNEQKNNSGSEKQNTIDNDVKYKNQWVMDQGVWVYYGSDGYILKNAWYNDANSGKSYFLNENGVMVTGWYYYNGKWYYFNEDGSRHSGWKFLMGLWYYMDSEGIMKTGWMQDSDGKWYYFDGNGVMLKNTKVDGYKLGDSGALIN